MNARDGRGVFRHILIATDGSPVGNKAARAGVALAKALGSRVTAYYAVDELQALYVEGYMMDQAMMDDLDARAKALGEKRVQAIAKIAKAAGVRFNAWWTNRPPSSPGTGYHSRCSGDSFHTTFEDEIRV